MEEKNLVLVLYVKEDKSLFEDLRPHLKMVEYSFPTVGWTYWEYPIPGEGTLGFPSFEKAMRLSQVWILCISADLVSTLLSMERRFPALLEARKGAQLLPLPFRPILDQSEVKSMVGSAFTFGQHEKEVIYSQLMSTLRVKLQRLGLLYHSLEFSEEDDPEERNLCAPN